MGECKLIRKASGGGGGGVKSTQRGLSTMSSGVTILEIDISEVDLTQSMIVCHYASSPQTTTSPVLVRAKFKNSTTIQLLRDNNTGNLDVVWQVIEYVGVKSHQYVEFDISSSGTGSATISAVDLTKTITMWSRTGTFNDGTLRATMGAGYLSNSTTFTWKSYPNIVVQGRVSAFILEFE